MLDSKWNCKLVSFYFVKLIFVVQIDLGDAKFANEEEEECAEDSMTEEQKMQADFAKMGGGRRGTMVGTINYVSPEMIKD